MNTAHYEQKFCFDCLCIHWVEISPTGSEICHGSDYMPRDTKTQYIKRSGRGFDVVQKEPAFLPQDLALEWQIKARG